MFRVTLPTAVKRKGAPTDEFLNKCYLLVVHWSPGQQAKKKGQAPRSLLTASAYAEFKMKYFLFKKKMSPKLFSHFWCYTAC